MTKSALVVHGGAGNIPDEMTGAFLDGCEHAALEGWRLLQAGGSALDAVEGAVRIMEDDPAFDAGRGSHLNRSGKVEMDAIIMDGATLNAGAIAAVEQVRNPITLARCVMDDTEHIMIIGEGAEQFAREKGLELKESMWFVVGREYEGWRNGLPPYGEATYFGTVGCVARDSAGNLAVATSTGGTANKLPGRVGDSPLIGSGGYADNQSAAVSATGWGESLMRVVMSKTTCDFVNNGMSAQEAANAAIRLLIDRVGGSGGVIVVDHDGLPGMAFNTKRMARAWIDHDGEIRSAIDDLQTPVNLISEKGN